MPTAAAGTVIVLSAQYQDGTGTAVVPTTPRVSILDPLGAELVNDAVPTAAVGVGRYDYSYAIPLAGPLGSWTAVWTGIINGAGVESSEVFAVVAAGQISFGGGRSGLCEPWADISDACAPCNDYAFDPGALEDGIAVASEILYNLTGRRWPGICEDTVRPPTTCGCVHGGGCDGVSEVILPAYPVVSVTQVVVDGAVVDPVLYRVDDRQRLVFEPALDGSGLRAWPCCQRRSRASGEDDTWSVTYLHGQEPTAGGVRAAAALGCQLALSCLPDGDPLAKQCRLPKRVSTITRQGLTLAVIDPLTLFKDGQTGIPEVDMWLASVALGDSRRRSRVFVPGRKSRARRTT